MRDLRDKAGMKIFERLAQLERAVALGALARGDCVCVGRSHLRALGDAGRARLTRQIAAAGARLCEDGEPEAAVVYSPGERRPPGC